MKAPNAYFVAGCDHCGTKASIDFARRAETFRCEHCGGEWSMTPSGIIGVEDGFRRALGAAIDQQSRSGGAAVVAEHDQHSGSTTTRLT